MQWIEAWFRRGISPRTDPRHRNCADEVVRSEAAV